MKRLPPPQPVNLTAAERRILSAFQAMDGRRKSEATSYMEEIAKEFPCPIGHVPGGVK